MRGTATLRAVRSLWQTHRGVDANWGRLASPTVQRQHQLSREGSLQSSLCPYGGICWISLMNCTGQADGSSRRIVREKRGRPGITVEPQRKKTETKRRWTPTELYDKSNPTLKGRGTRFVTVCVTGHVRMNNFYLGVVLGDRDDFQVSLAEFDPTSKYVEDTHKTKHP